MSQHHDPVHPDAGHLSAEVLADLDLGLLDDESATHATHHLAQCDACQQLHADLASLTDALHGLGQAPGEPMPEAVWTQLSGALAAEPVTTPEGSATVVPLEAARTRRRRPGIGIVAGAAGIALLGAIGVSWVMSDGTTVNTASDSSATGDTPGESSPQLSAEAFAATRSGTQYKQEQLEQQVIELVAARPAADSAMTDSSASPSASLEVGASPSPDVSATMTDRQTPNPNGVVGKLLASAGAMATDPAAAQACLENYLDAGDTAPLAIDIGLWQGKPAAVIVLPLDPTQAQVWVINPTCETEAGQDPTYYFATVSR